MLDECPKKHRANDGAVNGITCNFRLGIIAHETDHIEPRRLEVLSDGHTVAAGGAGNEDALDRHGLTEIPSATT